MSEEKAKRIYGFFNAIENPPQVSKNKLNSLFKALEDELKRFCDDDEVMNEIKKLMSEIKKEVLN